MAMAHAGLLRQCAALDCGLGLFAVYTATFASYNKTWGALSAVIVMLTWLWITGMALLLGAEINAETERSRALRKA
jgi:membrane protein